MDIKTLDQILKPVWDGDSDCKVEIFETAKQEIKDLLMECVGENENTPEGTQQYKIYVNGGYNQAKSEIRSRINKMFEEK